MGERTGIAWTDHTFNPWWGCAKVSAGCKSCYAETLSARFHGDRLWGVGGDRKIASEATWREPLKWNSQAEAAGKRSRVFCASMADVFERHATPEVNAKLDAARARLWALIEATPHLDWQLLTKRPENIGAMVPDDWNGPGAMPTNVWLGTSVCGDHTDRKMIDSLFNTRSNLNLTPVVRFLSYEPAVGFPGFLDLNHNDFVQCAEEIDWIIVGGESGRNARGFQYEWARAVVEFGKRHNVPVFVKQMGSNPAETLTLRPVQGDSPAITVLMMRNLTHKSGADPAEWPGELRVQQFPTPT